MCKTSKEFRWKIVTLWCLGLGASELYIIFSLFISVRPATFTSIIFFFLGGGDNFLVYVLSFNFDLLYVSAVGRQAGVPTSHGIQVTRGPQEGVCGPSLNYCRTWVLQGLVVSRNNHSCWGIFHGKPKWYINTLKWLRQRFQNKCNSSIITIKGFFFRFEFFSTIYQWFSEKKNLLNDNIS